MGNQESASAGFHVEGSVSVAGAADAPGMPCTCAMLTRSLIDCKVILPVRTDRSCMCHLGCQATPPLTLCYQTFSVVVCYAAIHAANPNWLYSTLRTGSRNEYFVVSAATSDPASS